MRKTKKTSKFGSVLAVLLILPLLSGCTVLSDMGDIFDGYRGPAYTGTSQTASDSQDDYSTLPGAAGEGFTVFFLDVGQADSAVVLCDGCAMLIDGGNVEDSSRVVTVLRKLKVSHLDAVVGTHADEDHIGGLSGPLSVMTAETVFAPKTGSDTKAYTNFVKAVKKQGLYLTHPAFEEKLYIGTALVTFLSPTEEIDTDNTNNTSIVLKAEYGKTSFLFEADAGTELETAIVESGADLSATVLKVGHHGSSYSTSYRFLREVMPQYAVISVGKNNSYGHPDEGTLSRLSDANAKILRTDEQGDIIISSDGKKLTFYDKAS